MNRRTLACTAAITAAIIAVLSAATACQPDTTTSNKATATATTGSKTTAASPSQSASDPVGYLYDVDEHRRSRGDVQHLVQQLGTDCTDNTLGLEFTATNTATDLVDAEHAHQDVYAVLAQLVSGLPKGSGKMQCASRLPAVEKQIKAKRAASVTPTPTHAATTQPQPAPAQTTHRPTVQRTTSAPVDDHGGATALCVDGTLSYSQHHQGACSHHHGVAVWYK